MNQFVFSKSIPVALGIAYNVKNTNRKNSNSISTINRLITYFFSTLVKYIYENNKYNNEL